MEKEQENKPTTLPVGIVKKLAKLQRDVGYMEKGGKNTTQGYKYLSEAQIAETFKELLEKHGVLFTYSSEIGDVRPSPTGKQLVTDVTVYYRFVDTATGEYISGMASGQGSDSTDKGIYKAITGAVKYIFMKTFLIPTGDDPEDDGKSKGDSSVYTSRHDKKFLNELDAAAEED